MYIFMIYLLIGCIIAIVGTVTGGIEIKYISPLYRVVCQLAVIVLSPLCLLIGFFVKPKR